jgi:hypothetical protein
VQYSFDLEKCEALNARSARPERIVAGKDTLDALELPAAKLDMSQCALGLTLSAAPSVARAAR